MKEQIYTIPLNDAFSKNDGCSLCRLFNELETNEIDRITGAAMMEPNVRVETNERGFCFRHFEMIANNGKRHPTALIIQSHLEEITSSIKKKKGIAALKKYIEKLDNDCYICNRLNNIETSIIKNFFYLYSNDENFVKKVDAQSSICFPHAKLLLKFAETELHKKETSTFCDKLSEKLLGEIEILQKDINWFCKKFDYRYKDEDWKNSKDSIERTILTLTGQYPKKDSES